MLGSLGCGLCSPLGCPGGWLRYSLGSLGCGLRFSRGAGVAGCAARWGRWGAGCASRWGAGVAGCAARWGRWAGHRTAGGSAWRRMAGDHFWCPRRLGIIAGH